MVWVDVLFTDFEKAFDKVLHRFLVHKAQAYGIDGKILEWIKAFLYGRKQRIVMGKTVAEWLEVLSGVPQGSVLGPLLFIIFINDLPEILKHFVKLFADDGKLIAAITEEELRVNQFQKDIKSLEKWCDEWSMCLNVKKCKIMHLGKDNPRRPYYMFDKSSGSQIQLETTSVERDLGIIISDDGSFEPQVNASIARANKVLGKMRNTFKYFTSDIVKILYPVYIRPHLEFAAPVWNALSKEDLKKLETFQRKVTRYATDLNGLDYAQRLEALKITTIKDRRIRGDLIQYFKIKNGHDDIRLLKEPKLQKSKRPHDQKIEREAFNKCNQRFNFLTNRIAGTWNNLPSKAVEAQSLNGFKARIDKHMSSKYFKNQQY